MRKLLSLILLSLALHSQSFAQQDSVYLLDLQECVRIALENNLSIQRSVLFRENARVNMDQSRASQLPNVNLGGSYGYNWGRSIDPTSNQFITQQINFTGLNGNANMVLFNWFRLANTVKQNQLILESTEFDEDKAKNDISLNIATFYLNVIFNKELVDNANFQIENSRKQLERTKKLVASGSLARTSELELISQVASNEVNLITAQNNLDLALLNLKQGMMLPATQKIDIVIPDIDMDGGGMILPPVSEVYSAALDNMPEIKSAELMVQSAEMGIDVAKSGYTPTISLNAGFSTNYSNAFKEYRIDADNPYTFNTDANGDVITTPTFYRTTTGLEGIEQLSVIPNGTFSTVGFSTQFKNNLSKQLSMNLSIPIFNNLRNSSNVQRQKIALRQAEINVLEQQNFLRQTVETAHNDANAAAKVYSASQKQVDALVETFRSIENQYNFGAANFTEYQVASNNLFGAKSDLVRAKYDYIFKTKILDFYLGKTLSF
ncbi:MAG: outer membrane protein [Cyclobacteriaceae bacterium]|jgi:outer membrane protein